MKGFYHIANNDQLIEFTQAISAILEIAPVSIQVLKKEDAVSRSQTNLYHKWCREIGNELGYEVDDIKHEMKKKFMLMIYVLDNINGFTETAKTMQNIRNQIALNEYEVLRDSIVSSMSHLDLDKGQMSEYLSSIKMWAGTEMNIRLTEPSMEGLI